MLRVIITLGTVGIVAFAGDRSRALDASVPLSGILAGAAMVGAAEELSAFEGATCVLCPNCGPENYHRAFAYANGLKSGEHESCLNAGYSGECPGHAQCGEGETLLAAQLQRLEALIRDGGEGSLNAIVALTTEFPSHVILVPERSALQVTLCGSIVGHLTLSSSAFVMAVQALPSTVLVGAPAP